MAERKKIIYPSWCRCSECGAVVVFADRRRDLDGSWWQVGTCVCGSRMVMKNNNPPVYSGRYVRREAVNV